MKKKKYLWVLLLSLARDPPGILQNPPLFINSALKYLEWVVLGYNTKSIKILKIMFTQQPNVWTWIRLVCLAPGLEWVVLGCNTKSIKLHQNTLLYGNSNRTYLDYHKIGMTVAMITRQLPEEDFEGFLVFLEFKNCLKYIII